MRAVQLQAFDGPDGLRLVELPNPVPGTGQVRVDLVAAALNRRDYWIRVGGKVELPAVLGSDGAGIVSAVGAGVTSVRVGDEVVINPSLDWGDEEDASGSAFRILGVPDQGTYAEQIVVAAHQVRPRPPRLTWLESAALPLAGLTAWRVLVTHAEAAPGKKILVPGAGGGVATFLIQIAAALGAHVAVTTGSAEKLEWARELGAESGALYTDDDWPQQVAPVDAIADSIGAPVWERAFELLRPGGRLISFGDTARATAEVQLSDLYFGYFRIQGTTMGSPREFDALLAHVERAAWRPVIDSVFPLEEAAQAHGRLEAPDRFGKVVLVVEGGRASSALPPHCPARRPR